MSAPRACYSSLALPTRENCDSATLSVAGSRMSTTVGCSRINGRDRCRHSGMQKARCKATLRDNTFQIAPDGRPQRGLPGDHKGSPLLCYAACCRATTGDYTVTQTGFPYLATLLHVKANRPWSWVNGCYSECSIIWMSLLTDEPDIVTMLNNTW